MAPLDAGQVAGADATGDGDGAAGGSIVGAVTGPGAGGAGGPAGTVGSLPSPGDAVVRVPGISVIRLTVQHILAPTIPRRWIAAIPIAERGIVHHVALVAIPLLCRREIGESTLLR